MRFHFAGARFFGVIGRVDGRYLHQGWSSNPTSARIMEEVHLPLIGAREDRSKDLSRC